MGKGGKVDGFSSPDQSNEQSMNPTESANLTFYTWSQIKESRKWFVINGLVYDISKFSKKHPGGERLMMNHVGQDATVGFDKFTYNCCSEKKNSTFV
jgi:stearoyl-CoA desaturase (Delta-9 desaturase)